jgi:cell division protease FtsH
MKNGDVYITLAWAVVLLLRASGEALNGVPSRQAAAKEVSFSQLLDGVDAGQVRDVIIRRQRINGTFNDGREFSTYALSDPALVNRLYSRGIAIKAGPPENIAPFASLLFSWLPLFLVIGRLIGMQRRSGDVWTNPFGLGTSRAKLFRADAR